jgi:hypothetical protein
MNQDNYATFEAAQRLVDAGIVLETDCYWKEGLIIVTADEMKNSRRINPLLHFTPAPSMADIWRELPEDIDGHWLGMGKVGEDTYVFYRDLKDFPYQANPTDALIDLLIWVKAQKEGVK